MKPKRIIFLLSSFLLLLILAAFGFLPDSVLNSPTVAANNTAVSADVVSNSTIVIAMAQEPDSLYLYGTSMLAALHVMAAFMDGPIDNVNYDYQPVILEKLPNLDDGDALINSVPVSTGSIVVNAYGDVVALAPGMPIVNSTGQTIVFNGSPVSMNQMQVTFTLKAGISWSDGTPLTTTDSVFSQQVYCHPDTPGSKFVCERTASYTSPNGQTAVWLGLPGYQDPQYQLRFWKPLPEHVLGSTSPGAIPNSNYATKPLGWGAFQVDEWIPGDSIKLSRNPHYWRPDYPKVDALIFKFYPDMNQALDALLAGQVHFVTQDATSTGFLPSVLPLEAEAALQTHVASGTVWEHIDFNILPTDNRYVFFDDPEVRQAITLCTNRQEMNDVIYLGQGEIIHAYTPSSHPIYQISNATEWLYNPTEGRNKLNAAGWLLGADGWRYKNGQKFSVTLTTTNGNELRQQISQIFKENLATCGVEVTLEYLSSSELFANDGPLFGRKYDLALFAWLTGIEPSCNLYLSNQIYVGGSNNTGYSNPAFDSACQSALAQLPGTTQYRDAHVQALEIWTEDVPAIPLLLRVKMALSNPNIVGVQIDSTESSELWNVEEWSFTAMGIATTDIGGSVTSNDGRTVVQIPPGAFTESVTLQHTPWVPEPTGELSGVGQFFELTALYESNGQPATLSPGVTYNLTVTYSPSQLPFGAVKESLALYAWNGSQWVREPTSTLNLANRTITATPNHFSLWTLLVETDVKQIWLPVILRN